MSTRHLPDADGPVDLAGLAAVHALVRDLLGELDRVARAAGVPYFLAYGTALGAVRDGDLIPWDVDADVWLQREHHQRFLDDAVPLLGERYELVTPETHADYEYVFPRLALKGVHHVFLRVDLFPLDPAPASERLGLLHLRVMRLLAQVFFVKRARTDVRLHYSARKRLLTQALRLLALPLPDHLLLALFRRLQGLHRTSSGRLVNSCGSYGARELLDAAWFDSAIAMPVAGLTLPVPQGYDDLLIQVYGDYLTPVPATRQQQELVAATANFVRPLRELGVLPEIAP